MATELAKAYVQIIPSAKGIKGQIEDQFGGGAESAGASIGGKLVGAIKKVIAVAAIGKAISASLMEGAALEQSLGGVETLFKDSAEKVKANAAQAYKTAGMSANQYMELSTSFAASLLQSLAGDTQKAADISDMAMRDMSDNANKFGTDVGRITDAYQGFAKQNYTMLDNLKLGYGGTKTEMERLLKDAEKLTGVKYDINNLSDVYSAIHAIQEELGVTGTTAEEAAKTLSGSFNSMKAAFKNVLGNLTLGKDITPSMQALADTVTTFLVGNLIPAIWNILKSLPTALVTFVTSLGPQLKAALSQMFGDLGGASGMFEAINRMIGTIQTAIKTRLPEFLNQGVEIATSIMNGIIKNLPGIIAGAKMIVSRLLNTLFTALPQLLQAGGQLRLSLMSGIVNNLPQIIEAINGMIGTIQAVIQKHLPEFLNQGVKILTNIMDGIIENIPTIINGARAIVSGLINTLLAAMPQLIQTGWQLLSNLVVGIVYNLPQIIGTINDLIGTIQTAIQTAIQTHLPDFLGRGVEILSLIMNGIIGNLPSIITGAAAIVSGLLSALVAALPQLLQAGGQLLLNLVYGIINNLPQLIAAAVQAVIGFLATLAQNLPQILRMGFEFNAKLAAGLIRSIPMLIGKIPEIIQSIVNVFVSTDWGSIGRNIIDGIAKGLSAAGGALWNAVKGILGNFKDNVLSFFGIHSPSRWGIYVGQMIDFGIAGGLVKGRNAIARAVADVQDTVKSPIANDPDLYMRGYGSPAAGGTVSDIVGKMQELIDTIRSGSSRPVEVSVQMKEREVLRALREMGVVFD